MLRERVGDLGRHLVRDYADRVVAQAGSLQGVGTPGQIPGRGAVERARRAVRSWVREPRPTDESNFSMMALTTCTWASLATPPSFAWGDTGDAQGRRVQEDGPGPGDCP